MTDNPETGLVDKVGNAKRFRDEPKYLLNLNQTRADAKNEKKGCFNGYIAHFLNL